MSCAVEAFLSRWHVQHFGKEPPAHCFPAGRSAAAVCEDGGEGGDGEEEEEEGEFTLELSEEYAARWRAVLERRQQRGACETESRTCNWQASSSPPCPRRSEARTPPTKEEETL